MTAIEDKFRLAGLFQRLGALTVDSLIISLPLFKLNGLVLDFNAATEIISVVIFFIYIVVLPVLWKGYVVGKNL